MFPFSFHLPIHSLLSSEKADGDEMERLKKIKISESLSSVVLYLDMNMVSRCRKLVVIKRG
jgi:hypothetical protein